MGEGKKRVAEKGYRRTTRTLEETVEGFGK
jgi:hypothetical protein